MLSRVVAVREEFETLTRKLIIFGVGEFARIAHEYFEYDSPWQVAGFAVDPEFMPPESHFRDLPVIPLDQVCSVMPPTSYAGFVAVPATRMNKDRSDLCARVKALGYELATYVSSKAFVWRNVPIGENTFIFESNVLQPFTGVGDRCILWSGNHIGHGTVIQDDVFISSHVVISGGCRIEHHSFLGVNATVNDGLTIGPGSLVGAHAHVTRALPGDQIYVGSPARPLPGKSSDDAGV